MSNRQHFSLQDSFKHLLCTLQSAALHHACDTVRHRAREMRGVRGYELCFVRNVNMISIWDVHVTMQPTTIIEQ